MIEFSLRGARPGDEITTEDATVQGHLRVRAAPWVDVTSVEIVVGGKSIDTFAIPARPAVFGPELGDKAEAEERTVRYDADVSVPVGQESTWVVVVVRGDRKMDDALPFMPVAPRAFTNPIYVKRSSPLAPPSPLPEPTHRPLTRDPEALARELDASVSTSISLGGRSWWRRGIRRRKGA